MSDGEGLGSGQSMNRNPPRNRTPPQTAPLPSSELPQLAPPPSGGVRWMDRSTDNRGVGDPPPHPTPRPPARPPRLRHSSNQRPSASPPDEDFPRLADGRVIQVPTPEIVGQVPQRDVAPERATVGQRGTAEPQWRQIIQDRYEERDRIQGIFAYSIPETNQTHLTRRGWPIGTTRQGSGYLLPNGIFVLPNVDGTPFIDPRTGRITSQRRSGVRDETFPARQAIASLNESLSDFAQEHRTDPHAQDFGIVIGSIEEFLVIADGILALPESIAELISLLPRIGSIYMDFQRLPEDEQVQVLGALAREGVNTIFGEIFRLAQESIQDAIDGRTLDANRKATRAIIKVITLVTMLKGAIRFLRRSPELFRRISGKIDELRQRGRQLADRFSESARELIKDERGSLNLNNLFPQSWRMRAINSARHRRTQRLRRFRGQSVEDYITATQEVTRNVITTTFREWALDRIISNPNHPLSFLIDPHTGNFRTPRTRRHSDLSNGSYVEMGHETSHFSGTRQRVGLEDAHHNQLAGLSERRGVIFEREMIDIEGIPVELETARLWVREGLLPEHYVSNRVRTHGWDIYDWTVRKGNSPGEFIWSQLRR